MIWSRKVVMTSSPYHFFPKFTLVKPFIWISPDFCGISDRKRPGYHGKHRKILEMSTNLYTNLNEGTLEDLMKRCIELEPFVTNGYHKINKVDWDNMLKANLELEEGENAEDGIEGGGIRHSIMHKFCEKLTFQVEFFEKENKINQNKAGLRLVARKAEKFLSVLYIWKPELDVNGLTISRSISETPEASEGLVVADKIVKIKNTNEASSLGEELKKAGCLVWYLYFLHFVDDGHDRKKPKIARTNLRVFHDGNNERINRGKVTLENLKEDSNSRNYEGEWEQLADCKVYIFNLWQPSEDEKERHLHFKVKFPNGRKRILFGSYSTYDTDDLYSGSLVFERIDEKGVLTDNIKPPLAISYDENPKDFEEIDESVIEYLSLARDNHLFTDGPLGSFNELKKWVETENPFSLCERRFFDYSKPRLFIACPQTSLKETDDRHKNLIEKLEKDLREKYESNLDITVKNQKGVSGELSSFENLKYLQRTKYFILILDEVKKATFSLVQLGWAMAYCKHILVFYKDNTVSSRFIADKDAIFKKRSYNDTEEGYNEMMIKILDFIDTNK